MPEEDSGELHVMGRPGWTRGRARGIPQKRAGGRHKRSVPPQRHSTINFDYFLSRTLSLGQGMV